ncbi:hypothetical protein [Labilibaculum sp.]|uniref:hypothetical protein n=1 Tax=Labilibaculum sp. TaxID=2060723 RepID=UPI003565F724
MSRFLPFAFLMSLLTINSCSIKNQYTSYWQDQRNFNSEIYTQTAANFYDSDNKISLKVFNNDEYLDLVIETNSSHTLRKIYNLGLSIWIDSAGKLKNNYAINYPLPGEIQFSEEQFRVYLRQFSLTKLNEEFMDRFQNFERVNMTKNEITTLHVSENTPTYQFNICTKQEVLFSYHLRISLNELYPKNQTEKEEISIGIANVNDANEVYESSLSSKEYINQRLNALKAGYNQNPMELSESWVNFKISQQP